MPTPLPQLVRVVVALGMALTLAGCSGSTANLFGADLYQQSCARCHGADGGGSGVGPAVGAGSNSVLLTDEQLADIIRVGPGTMPGFPRLGDEQVASLVEHLRTLQAEP